MVSERRRRILTYLKYIVFLIEKEFGVPHKKNVPHRFCQDDSCHWYLIPSDTMELFDNLLYESSNGDAGASDLFNETFSEYRLSGGLGSIDIHSWTSR